MIVIIDYGMGNLRSVQKAIEAVGIGRRDQLGPARVRQASKVVLPGVGAFADAMAELQRTGLGEAFCEAVRAGKPCLGVCLGLQLLFEKSHEDGEHKGLGLLPGPCRTVRRPAGSQDSPHGLEHVTSARSRCLCWRVLVRTSRCISCTRTMRCRRIESTSRPKPTTPIRFPRSSGMRT